MEYERLTKRDKDGIAIAPEFGNETYFMQDDHDRFTGYINSPIVERLAELEDKIEKGEIVELPNDVQTVLLRTIVYKTKFARTDYFAPFEARDDFGQPQIMSIDEQFYRTVIRLLGIKSREEAEAKLDELKGA